MKASLTRLIAFVYARDSESNRYTVSWFHSLVLDGNDVPLTADYMKRDRLPGKAMPLPEFIDMLRGWIAAGSKR